MKLASQHPTTCNQEVNLNSQDLLSGFQSQEPNRPILLTFTNERKKLWTLEDGVQKLAVQ